MQMTKAVFASIVLAISSIFSSLAFADASARGVATVPTAKKVSPADREAAISLAKKDAIERYFAEIVSQQVV